MKIIQRRWRRHGKNTANTLLVVDSLTATVSFAAIFTVPGEYDETSGLALFEHKTLLLIFVLFDSLPMFSSMLWPSGLITNG